MKAKVQFDLEALGKRVKEKRELLGLSTAQLATKSGVSATRINQIENCSPSESTNKVRRPRPETVGRLANALDLDEAELLKLAGHHAVSTNHHSVLHMSRAARIAAMFSALPEEKQSAFEKRTELLWDTMEMELQRLSGEPER